MNEPSEAVRVEVAEHTRKRAAPRGPAAEESKLATSATHALNKQPDHNDPSRYAQALAGVLRRWFGNEGLAVARELIRILEANK